MNEHIHHALLQHEMDGIQAWVEAMPWTLGRDRVVSEAVDMLTLDMPFTKAQQFDPEIPICRGFHRSK